jgi:DNA-binding CsgD family transcriptional regulator/catechol 2,3-dioxygenase-like lactoylglutathione lyase family enzyme
MANHRRRGRPPHPDVLTPAEWQVIEAVRHGMSNPQIARRLGVSVDAVKFHVTNALQKLGFEGRMQLRHWDGVIRGSALQPRSKSMSTDIRLGPIGQVSRIVSDINAAVAWYRDVLGLPHLFTFGTMAFFDCGGIRLYLTQGEGAPPGESILYFKVADIHAARDALAARGARFDNAPHMIHRHADGTEEWLAAFRDPDGRPLQLISQARPRE